MLNWTAIAVADEPQAWWGIDMAKENRLFLDSIDPDFFSYSANRHAECLSVAEDAHRAAIAIRLTYLHASETLFALLCAAVQAPSFPLGWLLSYRTPELRDLVDRLTNGAGSLRSPHSSISSWYDVSNRILEPLEDSNRDVPVIAEAYAEFWIGLAMGFLETDGDEYNSLKHGFRLHSRGGSLNIDAPDSGEPIPLLKSDHGSQYFKRKKLDRRNSRAIMTGVLWEPAVLVKTIQLIVLSMKNALAYLIQYGGFGGGQVRFVWPNDLTEFDAGSARHFQRGSYQMDYQSLDTDIEPKAEAEIWAEFSQEKLGGEGST